ncbi:trichohyalin [Centroberyx affinis]|uniref:trichohyalin n=1 Tax=Centroberyx affinis TaxID=166261 RepID=UPI003A5C2DF9
MNPGQVVSRRAKASVNHTNPTYRPSNGNKVLAERNQAVVPVGAWVEGGQDFLEHPSALASLTEELQAEKRRENEESLRRFQDEVRHRVAHQAQVGKKRQQLQKPYKMVEFEKRILQQFRDTTQRLPADEEPIPSSRPRESDISRLHVHVRGLEGGGGHGTMEQTSQRPSKGMRQVRHRLAACRMIPDGEMISDLPGGQWNISPTREKSQEVEEEAVLENEEEEEGDDFPLTSQHECPLVQHNTKEYPGHKSVTFHHGLVSGQALDQSDPDPGFRSDSRVPRVLWPLGDQEETRQRQFQFLMHRRLFMDIEREQVKENRRHGKHLKRIARIKTEKEQIRLEEERKMESLRQLKESRLKMEERELLILERLRLEEEERVLELEKRKLKKKEKEATRFIEALRAQMKERLSQEKLDLPPLCCCGSSFWDSHPDTCANNCVFHNNPKAYTQALHSALLSLDLQ